LGSVWICGRVKLKRLEAPLLSSGLSSLGLSGIALTNCNIAVRNSVATVLTPTTSAMSYSRHHVVWGVATLAANLSLTTILMSNIDVQQDDLDDSIGAVIALLLRTVIISSRFSADAVSIDLGRVLTAVGSIDMSGTLVELSNSVIVSPNGMSAALGVSTVQSFQTILTLDNVAITLVNTSFSSFSSLIGRPLLTFPQSITQVLCDYIRVLPMVRIELVACSSNRWNGDPLTRSEVVALLDQGLLTRHMDDAGVTTPFLLSLNASRDAWCIEGDEKTTEVKVPPAIAVSPSTTTATALVTTTIVGAVASSSAVARGTLPLVQGVLGTLRLNARCASHDTTLLDGLEDNLDELSFVSSTRTENLLMLRMPSGDAVETELSFAVGALLGNTLLLMLVALVSHVLHVTEEYAQRHTSHRQCHSTTSTSSDNKSIPQTFATFVTSICFVLPTVPFPASLLIFHAVLLEPTMTAGVACVASPQRSPASVIVGAVVAGVWIGIPAYFLWCVSVKHAPLPLITVPRSVYGVRSRRSESIVTRIAMWVMLPSEVWVPRGAPSRLARNISQKFGFVFDGYRRQRLWFFAVEGGIGVTTGVIVGLAASVDEENACSAAEWGTALALVNSIVAIAACLVLKPHLVVINKIAFVCNAVLASLAQVCVLFGYDYAGAMIATAAMILDVLIMVSLVLSTFVFCRTKEIQHHTISQSQMQNFAPVSTGSNLLDPSPTPTTLRRQPCGIQPRKAAERTVARVDVLKKLLDCICEKTRGVPQRRH
jgi:hypothetical protein